MRGANHENHTELNLLQTMNTIGQGLNREGHKGLTNNWDVFCFFFAKHVLNLWVRELVFVC